MKLNVRGLLRFATSMFDVVTEASAESQKGLVWQGQLQTSEAEAPLRRVLQDHLVQNRGCEAYPTNGTSDVWHRGNFAIQQLPLERSVGWQEVPIIVTATYTPAATGSTTHLRIAASSALAFDVASAEIFNEYAEMEFKLAGDYLRSTIAPRADRAAIEEAYRAFGLVHGAPWPEVQQAYRDASMQYHPDRFSGNSIPDHLIALAAERFAELTTKYQRIRDYAAVSGRE